MKTLSQSGLHRIPHNPNQRVAGEGGRKDSGIVLDGFNDAQEDRWLHPTKGWRNLNAKRSEAALRMAQLLHRDPSPRKGSTPNKYVPHIGAKQRAKGLAKAS